jgi:hypothetical protein
VAERKEKKERKNRKKLKQEEHKRNAKERMKANARVKLVDEFFAEKSTRVGPKKSQGKKVQLTFLFGPPNPKAQLQAQAHFSSC